MKNGMIAGFCLMAILLIAFGGCGKDEECPTCPKFLQKATMWGVTAAALGQIFFYGEITGIDATLPSIDSVKFAGNNVEIEVEYIDGFGVLGSNFILSYIGSAGGISSGDTARTEIFTPDGKCTCGIDVLEYPYDLPEVTTPEIFPPYDTVALNTSIVINWNPVENADWYLLYTDYIFGSGGEDTISQGYILKDEGFTIPTSMTNMNGRHEIVLYAVSGPEPDAATGNIQGKIVEGVINSAIGLVFDVIVGTGTFKGPSNLPPDKPEFDIQKIYEHLRNH